MQKSAATWQRTLFP